MNETPSAASVIRPARSMALVGSSFSVARVLLNALNLLSY